MEELDLLLEELALNPTASQNADENRSSNPTTEGAAGGNIAGLTKKRAYDAISNVYSDLPPPVAVSARSISPTQELDSILDELMNLGQEDPDAPPTPAPLTQKKKESSRAADSDAGASGQTRKPDTIDGLLEGLSFDLEKIGVKTVAKGHCASCNKAVVGKMITALGEVWHPEHFVCAHCKTELGSFFERDGRPYCSEDYHQLFSPRCAYCRGPILQNILTALDQTWHPEHFFCTHCGGLFGEEGFLEKDRKPYCSKDFYHLFSPKCSGCGEPVRENYLTAANGTWHPECFVCAECLKPFPDGRFMELNGRPLCSRDFHSQQGTLCSSCGEPIAGRCISALGGKFHPEHFVCAFCLRQLSQGIFKEEEGKPYCSGCFNRLFAN